jgi:CubicO group peptidase (beta-lactamase class C family)
VTSAADRAALAREFVAWAEQELARQQAPGAAVAVADRDEIVLEAGVGQRDAEAGLPVSRRASHHPEKSRQSAWYARSVLGAFAAST